MTTPAYRRARHSVSLLHAHLVFVTKYRRAVFTDDMLTFTEHTDHQAVHRRPSPATLTAGLRPATNRMGSPRTNVRGLRPRIRSAVGAEITAKQPDGLAALVDVVPV